MIEKFEIRYENNEEILYVELNFNYEFSKIELFNDIGKYLKKKKINFLGKKIVITVSGIALATLLLSKPVIKNIDNIDYPSYKYVSSIILNDYNEISKISASLNNQIKIDKYVVEKNAENEIKNNNNTNIKKENNIKAETNKVIKNNANKVTTNKEKEIVDENSKTQIKEEVKTEEKKEEKLNKTYVTVYRSNGSIVKLELEEYLIGVVSAEMPALFNIEALKAQSILARTYALKANSSDKKLTDTTSTQVYKDNSELKKLWGTNYNTYYNKIKKAVSETEGLTVKYNGTYIEAIYHSTSNGYTEDSVNVWGNSYSYLKSVESPYDKNVSSYKKTINFNYSEISSKLGINISKDSIIEYKRNESNRVNLVSIDGNVFKGTEFRSKLNLRSTDFTINLNEEDLSITTLGYGHGVGMSQNGANEMAKKGNSYKDIIYHYYKGVSITK